MRQCPCFLAAGDFCAGHNALSGASIAYAEIQTTFKLEWKTLPSARDFSSSGLTPWKSKTLGNQSSLLHPCKPPTRCHATGHHITPHQHKGKQKAVESQWISFFLCLRKGLCLKKWGMLSIWPVFLISIIKVISIVHKRKISGAFWNKSYSLVNGFIKFNKHPSRR